MKKNLISISIATAMTTTLAHAGSFSLYTESSAAAIGNYAAGIAAEAADASTGWYNPAGLVLLPNQELVIGGVGIFASTSITGTSTFATSPLPNYVQSYRGIDGAKDAFVPSLHFAKPLSENVTAGLSVVAPFGLSTNWGYGSPVRYQATYSNLLTVNVAPELGGRITDYASIGGGIDFQYATVEFNRALGIPTLGQLADDPRVFDSQSVNKGQSFGLGFHAGILLTANDNHSRFGVNYQSKVNHKFHGYSKLSGRLASDTLLDDAAVMWSGHLSSNNVGFPQVVTISGYQDVNANFALLASAVYTGWSSLKYIELDQVSAFAPGVGPALLNSSTSEFYRNVWRFALGANYHVNETLMLRAGGGYDQTPTTNAFRDVRIADANRWALSIGAHYQAYPSLGGDLGYTHLFGAERPTINKTESFGTSSYNVNATAKASADLVGGQIVWTMDSIPPSNMKA